VGALRRVLWGTPYFLAHPHCESIRSLGSSSWHHCHILNSMHALIALPIPTVLTRSPWCLQCHFIRKCATSAWLWPWHFAQSPFERPRKPGHLCWWCYLTQRSLPALVHRTSRKMQTQWQYWNPRAVPTKKKSYQVWAPVNYRLFGRNCVKLCILLSIVVICKTKQSQFSWRLIVLIIDHASWFFDNKVLTRSNSVHTMSESTHLSSSSQRAACNPYSQAAINESLAAFLDSHNLPGASALRCLVERPLRSKQAAEIWGTRK
jgi:hypothetical protein